MELLIVSHDLIQMLRVVLLKFLLFKNMKLISFMKIPQQCEKNWIQAERFGWI